MEKIAFVSGKGGVGKSTLSLNIAVCLAEMGKKVIVVDANFSLANLDILAGLTPEFHVEHVVFGKKNIAEIMIKVLNGLSLVPASPGFSNMAEMSREQLETITKGLANLEADFLLIDCAPGIGRAVEEMMKFSDKIIVVITSEPTSVVNSYAVIKCICQEKLGQKISLLANKVESSDEGEEIYCKVSSITKRFLNKEVPSVGFVRQDDNVKRAIKGQALLVEYFPNTEASRDIETVSATLARDKIGLGEMTWPKLVNDLVN